MVVRYPLVAASALEVRSALPGRIRWDCRGLRDAPELARFLERVLRRVASLVEVVANPLTGRLLVRFSDDQPATAQDIARLAERVVARYARPRLRPRPATPRALRRAHRPDAGPDAHALRAAARTASLVLSAPIVLAGLAAGASPLAIGAAVVALQLALRRLVSLARLPPRAPSDPPRDPWQPLADTVWAARRPLGWAVVLGATSVALSLAPFALLGLAVSFATGAIALPVIGGVAASQTVVFVGLGAIGVGLIAAHAATEYAAQLLWRNTGETIMHELRMRAFRHAQHADAAYFIHESPGTVLSRLGEDINQIEKLFNAAWEFLGITVSVSLVGAALIVSAPAAAWLILLLVPGFVYATTHLRDRLIPLYQRVRGEAARLTGEMASSFDGLVTIKSFVAEERQIAQVAAQSQRMRLAARPAIAVGATFNPAFEIVVMSGIVLVAILGGLASGSLINFSLYAAVVLLVRQLLWPLSQLGVALEQYQRGLASYRRAMSVLDIPVERLDQGIELALATVRGEVELDDVQFGYATDDPVFERLALRMPAGKMTAIVGPSGIGKTTILKLLLRFYAPQRGQIRLDGHDIAELRLDSLRRAISVVGQDIFMFDGTIRDNLLFARPDASPADLAHTLEIAQLTPFINSLDDGLATRIGQRGLRLSGGQRQRLAIARAVLRDSPIVFFDEATSHVDNKTEAALNLALEPVIRNRTTIVVAHRLSTIAGADVIYVLDAGHVVERGTHRELLAAEGAYARMWALQQRRDD